MAVAHSRDWIDYESLFTEYWLEFAQNRKEFITVRQLLSHQAGLDAIHQRHGRHDWVIQITSRHTMETLDEIRHLIPGFIVMKCTRGCSNSSTADTPVRHLNSLSHA
ncbi:hypothetical protein [Symmachiella dynata]|uniref:hypothetical protein n=1 Tax=Symmachiella dynata TaxID=2527995 RepID=UPI003B84B74E